jgi:hypothetical protein
MDVWTRIDGELVRRHKTWAWLGRAIGASDQTMTNWKLRKKVPPGRYVDLARALGWSVEQLVGEDPTGSVNEPPVAYAVSQADDALHSGARGRLDGTDMTPQECELVSIFRQLNKSGRLVALGQVRLARDTEEHLQEALGQRREPSPAHIPHSLESGFGGLDETPVPKKEKAKR